MNRKNEIKDFLDGAGWGKAEIIPLAGDASFRRYDRIKLDDKKAVLMDAPTEFEDTRPFVTVAQYLIKCGLKAPKIFAKDLDKGFLLLEDLGDNLFKRVLEKSPNKERELYKAAVNELITLNGCPLLDGLPQYNEELYLKEVALFTDWYYPALTGNRLSLEKREEFLDVWKTVLSKLSNVPESVVLRDYHSENLLELDQGGVGQLDFQDAVIGNNTYDLVSLLQDARRDVDPVVEEEMIKYFAGKLNRDEKIFGSDYAILGAQRNIKIIGIFARLSLRDGKDNYLKLEPRVWGLLERCLEHPVLADVKALLNKMTPHDRHVTLSPKPLSPSSAIILAAGLGRRMRPLTDNLPKPLVKVAGKEMLSYTLDAIAAAGIKKAVINIHHFPEKIDEYFENRKDWRPMVEFSDETEQLMDSGGGVKKALPQLGSDPFYIFNSDMIWTNKGQDVVARLSIGWNDDMDMLMLLIKREKAFGHDGPGDFHMAADGRLTRRGDDAFSDYFYGGIMIIRPRCFENTPDEPFSLRMLFDRAVKKGRLYGLVHDGAWYHVGTPEAVIETEKHLNGE